ncbi:MAG: hypothetical protein VW862_06035 [Euryarchaeota archaeon]
MNKEEQYWNHLVEWLALYVRNEADFWTCWLERHNVIELMGYGSENLPEMLSMLALPFRNRMTIRETGWRNQENKCSYDQISNGVKCMISNNSTMNNMGFDRDHRWPESLGGIKHPTNQLDLCKIHNRAKMNGLWGYPWEPSTTPEWVIDVLSQMAKNVKRRLYQ